MTGKQPSHIFLVEDDDALGPAVADALRLEGMEVSLFTKAEDALSALPDDFPGVVVSDVRLPGMDGLTLFARLQKLDSELPVIFTTGHGDVEMAVAAMRDGAADFLTKPYSSAALIRATAKAAEHRRLVLENRKLRDALKQQAQDRFIGSSGFAVKMRGMLSAVAQSEVDVVVEGATGSGKTFVGRLIHDLGPRQNRPFIAIDAGILTHPDVELLLFGREPGRDGLSRTGLIERANGGTLLIDEIETAASPLQARLLSVLETRSNLPVGAERSRKLNVRVVVTRQLHEKFVEGNEGRSLFHNRLGAIKLTMLPLAQRRQDIIALFHNLLSRHEVALGLQHRGLTDQVSHYLQTHDWPGNVRELEAFAGSWAIGLSVPDKLAPMPAGSRSLNSTVAEFERAVIENALRVVNGDVTQLEQMLETPRKTLYDKLNRYRLRPRDFRAPSGKSEI